MEYDPYSDEAMRDPERLYEGLRAEGCPHFIESRKCWALTRFEDVQKASLAERNLDFSFGQTPGQLLLGEPVPRTFMTMNGHDHRKWRALVASAYSAETVAADAPRYRRLIREVLAPLLVRGEIDVYRDFANRVMCINAGTMLGLPAGDGERLRGLIDEMMHREPGQVGAGSPRNQQAAGTLFTYLMSHVAALRDDPERAEGLARIFLEAEVEGERLEDADIVSYLFSLLVTGSETTPMAVAGTVYYLGRHPEQKRAVLADRSLIGRAFAETLRFDQPTNMLARRARQDFELGGQQIRAGDNLLMIYAAANRDKARFDRPHAYDIFREPQRDLSFGAGPHYCLGAHLALLVGPMMIAELLDAVGDYELAADRCRRGYGEFLNGYVTVPIRFEPRYGDTNGEGARE